jgi:hypothetical protein
VYLWRWLECDSDGSCDVLAVEEGYLSFLATNAYPETVARLDKKKTETHVAFMVFNFSKFRK